LACKILGKGVYVAMVMPKPDPKQQKKILLSNQGN
jgi:hypothetical protein